MFSQYSWWDFAKFCLALAIPYYAYVLWVYYRQDIREWLSSRGRNDSVALATATQDDEDETSDLYSVNHYQPAPAKPAAEIPTKPAIATPDPSSQETPYQAQQSTDREGEVAQSDPDLNGVVLDEEETPAYFVTILAEADRPEELSLAEVMKAAGRVESNEEGVLSPIDPADGEAANIAEVINQQQAKKALSGIAFNR